jgi:hypothetical protein
MFGQALADALMLPLNIFNKLRGGLDWVLEKLGVIQRNRAALTRNGKNAGWQGGSYIPATSSLWRLSGLSAGYGSRRSYLH